MDFKETIAKAEKLFNCKIEPGIFYFDVYKNGKFSGRIEKKSDGTISGGDSDIRNYIRSVYQREKSKDMYTKAIELLEEEYNCKIEKDFFYLNVYNADGTKIGTIARDEHNNHYFTDTNDHEDMIKTLNDFIKICL